jgi:hypothetical protein
LGTLDFGGKGIMNENKKTRAIRRGRRLLLVAITGIYLGLAANCFGETKPGACAGNSESRQLDYWYGNWAMTDRGGASANSISNVSLSLDKCLFVERWDSGKGHTAEKMFAYSPDDKTWYGMFADNEGRAHIFLNGTVASGTAEFHGTSRGPNGEEVLNKLRIVQIQPNGLVETWEKSMDHGVKWTTVYRAEYLRTNP